jgi:hypothetical protein
MVFAKSYNAQLARSIQGARPAWGDGEPASRGCDACMIPSGLIDGSQQRPKLPCMPLHRPCYFVTIRPLVAAAALVLFGACERRKPSRHADSTMPLATTAADAGAARRGKSGWNIAAGPALLVQGPTPDEAVVLFPTSNDSDAVAQLDSASLHDAPVILLGRGGTRFSAQLGDPPNDAADDCERWALRSISGAPEGAAWSVGFVNGRVTALPLDSVDVLSSRDSMALVAEASRLASSVRALTGPSFQGLRFTVHDIRRFQAAPGVQAMVAHLIRRVNQEANPQEEQTLLVAERDSGATSGPYQLAYAERAFGREERVIAPEVLSALRIGGSTQPSLVVARDSDDGVVYVLLERIGPRRWRVRWSSGVTRCG